MEKLNNYFNTESVSDGHPDKIADQISELVLDYLIGFDEDAHVSCEVFVTGKKIIVGGEIKGKSFPENGNLQKKLKERISDFLLNKIKYNDISWPGVLKIKENIDVILQQQSSEINVKVSKKNKIGAGDNTVVFGWANNDKNSNYFPKFQNLANKILSNITKKRKENNTFEFAPDGKIRITIDEKKEKLIQITLCQQFETKIEKELIKNKIKNEIIIPILKELSINEIFNFKFINFKIGGPSVDTGLTGRKLMVDTYGTFARNGGGSFAGKDVSKTDKTLALFARLIAKHIVVLGLAEEIEIQMSSFIGEVSGFCMDFKTIGKSNHDDIKKVLKYFSNWSLSEIINNLELKKIEWIELAKYGYFGKNNDLSWEKLNYILEIKKILD